MKNLRNLRIYNKLQKAFNTAKLINEEVTAEKRPYKATDAPPTKEEYADKSALLLNMKKVGKGTNRENSFIIEGSLNLVKRAKEVREEVEFTIQNIVVDLTKLKNEIEQYNSSKAKDIEELKKLVRYFVTYKNQTDKAIKDAEAKRQKIESEIDEYNYEKELAELRKKYGYDKVDELDDFVAEQNESASVIQEEYLTEIRKIRDIIRDTVDLPIDILNNVRIYTQALGAVAVVSKKTDRLNMKKKGIEKVLATPELRKELEEFITITEQADRVQVIKTAMPQLETYYAELKAKYETEMMDFDEAKSQVDESMFGDIVLNTIDKMKSRFKKFIKTMKNIMNPFHDKIETTVNSISSNIDSIKKDNAEFKSRFAKLAIKINSETKKVEYETSKEISDEVQ